MKIYTRKGDDGTTGLLYGGRVSKRSVAIELNGAIDEAQSAIGVVRAGSDDSELGPLCVHLESDLWIVMAEVATLPSNRTKLVPGSSMVSSEMIEFLEHEIDHLSDLVEMPTEFVVPGETMTSARLDVARTTVRRAERIAVDFVDEVHDSLVGAYLNRLSDLLWIMARWQETTHLKVRDAERKGY
ncbi:MAG: cob(I)yrinic acid a,c-diamide adenosyltransferase [Acidimicrobiales bacterium]